MKKSSFYWFMMLNFFFFITTTAIAQTTPKYFTRNGNASFFSDSPMEKIEATTNSANCVVDMGTGQVEVAVLIKSFNFPKALMQEHFNENYMESNKYPKAVFKGTIKDIKPLNLSANSTQTYVVEGDITMHGNTKHITSKAIFRVEDGKIFADTEFELTVADFNITIPSIMKDNIGKVVKVKLKTELQELKKT